MSADPAARFGFGENWRRFSRSIDESRIAQAVQSMRDLLQAETLAGRTFLDIGSGSGLFSLAAHRLGARVTSFDYDPQSVACTQALRESAGQDPAWDVFQGSILDPALPARLGTFDIVYSWGVLHHTGHMREAFDNAAKLVAPGGWLALAIYNDQGAISRYWTGVKRLYNAGAAGRAAMVAVHAPYLIAGRWVARALTGRLRLERGMNLWHDMHDWLGGWPFEVATPAQVQAHFAALGFAPEGLSTCGTRMGCNEFLFRRAP